MKENKFLSLDFLRKNKASSLSEIFTIKKKIKIITIMSNPLLKVNGLRKPDNQWCIHVWSMLLLLCVGSINFPVLSKCWNSVIWEFKRPDTLQWSLDLETKAKGVCLEKYLLTLWALHKDNSTTPENVLGCNTGGEAITVFSGDGSHFQSILKWVCLRWWITSELFFEALRISETYQKQIFSFSVHGAILGKFPSCFQSSAEQMFRHLSCFTQCTLFTPIPPQEPAFSPTSRM